VLGAQRGEMRIVTSGRLLVAEASGNPIRNGSAGQIIRKQAFFDRAVTNIISIVLASGFLLLSRPFTGARASARSFGPLCFSVSFLGRVADVNFKPLVAWGGTKTAADAL
jgi:hypothetical protein